MSSSETAPSGKNNNNNDENDNNGDQDNTTTPPPPSKSSSPPASENKSSTPPPPNDNSESSPPPPPNDNSESSPPPPPNDNGKSSPPPPSKDNNNSSPPPPNGKGSSPQPPKNDDNSFSSKGSSRSLPSQSDQNNNRSPTPSSQQSSESSKTRAIAPPSEKGKRKDSGSDDFMPGGMSTQQLGLIIGITAGVVVLLFFMILFILCCCKKKKRRTEIHYYMDSGPKGNGSEYYNSGQHPSYWQNGPMDHAIKVQPTASPSGPMSGGWLHPPPPPPMMQSSEMSSTYSGPRGPVLPPPSPNMALGFGGQSNFTYEELAMATDNFSESNLLGQGGFGYVHKGVLSNGTVVAVKSLKSGSGQGEREFQAEVEIISRVHHRHLVSLAGYCIAGGRRMLIYEFVPNKTLEYHLHGKGVPVMDWTKRMTIAMGSAKGLAYLHEDCHPRIIHRDIKTANILIDDNFEAMVADFGLAKLSDTNNTHVSTRVMGTFGYLAPEYASSGKLTEKSDVFSFGVMLLELITGKRPVDSTDQYMEDSLVDWARPILSRAVADGNYEELVDPRLGDNYDPDEMTRMVACAAASVRHSARRRPKMSQIVRALEGAVSLEDLNEVRTQRSQLSSNGSCSDYDTAQYNADMKKFRNMALNSQEYSSEYSAQTSDYGRDQASTSSNSEASNSREVNRGGNNRL